MREVARHATKCWPSWRRLTMTRTISVSTSSRSTINDWPSNMASRTFRPSHTSARGNRSFTKVRLNDFRNFQNIRMKRQQAFTKCSPEQKRINVMIPNGWKFAKLLLESGRDLGNLARYEKQGSRLAAV